MQRALCTPPLQAGLHVAIIMDGNGRWAAARGLARVSGHKAGGQAVRRTIEAAPGLGVKILTLYAFSADNWQRPPAEVAALMKLFRKYLLAETESCRERGIKLQVIGRRDRLNPSLVTAISAAESRTAEGHQLELRIAVDYSARESIVRAARLLSRDQTIAREDFARALAQANCESGAGYDVDLLIRTGGEQRLSDFLLWECAYAEFVFTNRMWPDFDAGDLKTAITEFQSRQRRFGGLPEAATR
jgi:undecaprenyl diphosphate synthase